MSVAAFASLALTALLVQQQDATSPERFLWRSKESFTGVAHVYERPDGSVLVVSLSEPAVKLLRRDGTTVRTIGRKGAGPGEYQQPRRALSWTKGRTLVVDRALRRLLVLDSTLIPTGVISFPPGFSESALFARGTDPQGKLIMQSSWLGPDLRKPTEGVYLLRWDLGSNRVDTITRLQPPEVKQFQVGSGAGRSIIRRVMPFASQDDWAVGPDGVVAVVRARDFRVEWYRDGKLVVTGPAIAYRPVSVSTQDKQFFEEKGPPLQLTYPTTKPPFVAEGTLVAPDESVWIELERASGTPSRNYLVVDRTGHEPITKRIGPRRWIFAFGKTALYVVWTDENDENWVEAYRR